MADSDEVFEMCQLFGGFSGSGQPAGTWLVDSRGALCLIKQEKEAKIQLSNISL